MPNVETNRQIYSKLNKTSLCSEFWGIEIPNSGLNLCFQAVAAYFWFLFWLFSMGCYDFLSRKCPILNEEEYISGAETGSTCGAKVRLDVGSISSIWAFTADIILNILNVVR